MPRIDKPSQRSRGRRSGGGRPPKAGERYANGRLKPEPPNPVVVAAREKLGFSSLSQRATPLEVIQNNGWLDAPDLAIVALVVATYANAGLREAKLEFKPAAPFDRLIAERNPETWEDTIDFEVMSRSKEGRRLIAALWDSGLRKYIERFDEGLSGERRPAPAPVKKGQNEPPQLESNAAKSWRRWKAMLKAMTAEQRDAVVGLCVNEDWPQWVIQRCANRFETSWEAKRTTLIAGLAAIRTAVYAARPRPTEAERSAEPARRQNGPRHVYVERIIGPNDEVELEIVRISSRPPGDTA